MSERRCYICGSKNLKLHHRSRPIAHRISGEHGSVKECRQTVWYICQDCGRKIFFNEKVPDKMCYEMNKRGE